MQIYLRNKVKQYLLFLLIPIVICAQDNSYLDMKAKANSDGTIVKAKFALKNPMITLEQAKHSKIEANFISHVTATVENNIVLDISTSPYLSRDPVIKYKFKDLNQSNAINYILTNNKGKQKEHFFEIKREYKLPREKIQLKHLNTSVVNFRKTNPLAWKAKSSEEAIKALYGSVENPIKDKINLIMPEDSNPRESDCGLKVPVKISSNIDLESLAIFIDNIGGSTVAVISIPPVSIIDYELRVKIRGQQYTLIVIGKDREGRFYQETHKGRLPSSYDECL